MIVVTYRTEGTVVRVVTVVKEVTEVAEVTGGGLKNIGVVRLNSALSASLPAACTAGLFLPYPKLIH